MSPVYYGEKFSFLGWLLFVELIGLFILFFGLFYTLLGANFIYGYGGFYLGLSLPIVFVSIIMGGQFYLYYIFKEKSMLKPFLSSIQEYNETISTQLDKLKCIKCGIKENLKKNKYTWRLLGENHAILSNIKENDENASVIPLCLKCSPDFEIWANKVSRRKTFQIIAVVLILSSLIFLFSFYYFFVFIIMIFIARRLIKTGNKYIKFPEFSVGHYVKNELNQGIIFRPENSSRWISHKEWLEEEPVITIKGQEGEIICKNCQSPLEPDSKFCTQCGWSNGSMNIKQSQQISHGIILGKISNFLRDNKGKAFTFRALDNRIENFFEDPNEKEYCKRNLQNILKELTSMGSIKSVQRGDVIHYFF